MFWRTRQSFIWPAIRLWLIIGRRNGLSTAGALYMFVKPGEYANYPKGKNDAAHVRDLGAFFYAKGAIEMARMHDATLKDFFKSPSSVTFVPSVE